jgi:putative hydrolase of the HAD superfamily
MNIVFDIGNVICEWNAEKLVRSVFRDEAEQQKALRDIIGHPDWFGLDKGTIELEEAVVRAVARTGIREERVRKLYRDTPPSLVPFPETVRLIKDLKAQSHRLYVLSNMHRHAYEYLIDTYDFWSLFDGIVISSHIKTIKPEPEIYQYLLKTWSLLPEETIFLDDLPGNLVPAAKLGIRTILVDNPAYIRRELEKIL